MFFDGFEWDEGNWPKCGKHGVGKHGVGRHEIEAALLNIEFRIDDPHAGEERYRTAVQLQSDRHVFVIFTYRQHEDKVLIRPISARYMHGKEVKAYEQAKKAMASAAKR